MRVISTENKQQGHFYSHINSRVHTFFPLFFNVYLVQLFSPSCRAPPAVAEIKVLKNLTSFLTVLFFFTFPVALSYLYIPCSKVFFVFVFYLCIANVILQISYSHLLAYPFYQCVYYRIRIISHHYLCLFVYELALVN